MWMRIRNTTSTPIGWQIGKARFHHVRMCNTSNPTVHSNIYQNTIYIELECVYCTWLLPVIAELRYGRWWSTDIPCSYQLIYRSCCKNAVIVLAPIQWQNFCIMSLQCHTGFGLPCVPNLHWLISWCCSKNMCRAWIPAVQSTESSQPYQNPSQSVRASWKLWNTSSL